jgi:DNA-binding NtrC family response regulator
MAASSWCAYGNFSACARILASSLSTTTPGFLVRSPGLAREILASSSYDAVLIDLNYARDTTSGQEGLGLLSDIVAIDSTLPVIVMTAWGNVDLAVEAMRRGARDFVQKPWENERLLAILRTQVELHRALQRAERLAAENCLLGIQGRPAFIATAPSMVPVLEAIARFAPSDANVLITGEHGTGKEVVARTIHVLSLRASRQMVAVNTGGLAEGVFESELFGHVKGAFTDARTDRMAASNLLTAARFFLMRSATCRCASNPSCCAWWSREKSNGWDRRVPSGLMCA